MGCLSGRFLGGVLEVALEVSWRSIPGLLGINLKVCSEFLEDKFVFSYVDILQISDSQTLKLSNPQTLTLSDSHALRPFDSLPLRL